MTIKSTNFETKPNDWKSYLTYLYEIGKRKCLPYAFDVITDDMITIAEHNTLVDLMLTDPEIIKYIDRHFKLDMALVSSIYNNKANFGRIEIDFILNDYINEQFDILLSQEKDVSNISQQYGFERFKKVTLKYQESKTKITANKSYFDKLELDAEYPDDRFHGPDRDEGYYEPDENFFEYRDRM